MHNQKGRPKKHHPEFLWERRSQLRNIFTWLTTYRRDAILYGNQDQVTRALIETGDGDLIQHADGEDGYAAWILEARSDPNFPNGPSNHQASFLADFIMARNSGSSVRYFRRAMSKRGLLRDILERRLRLKPSVMLQGTAEQIAQTLRETAIPELAQNADRYAASIVAARSDPEFPTGDPKRQAIFLANWVRKHETQTPHPRASSRIHRPLQPHQTTPTSIRQPVHQAPCAVPPTVKQPEPVQPAQVRVSRPTRIEPRQDRPPRRPQPPPPLEGSQSSTF